MSRLSLEDRVGPALHPAVCVWGLTHNLQLFRVWGLTHNLQMFRVWGLTHNLQGRARRARLAPRCRAFRVCRNILHTIGLGPSYTQLVKPDPTHNWLITILHTIG